MLAALVLTGIVSLLAGVALTLWAQSLLFFSASADAKNERRPFRAVPVQLPEDLLSKLHGLANDNGQATKCEASADGSNLAVNLLVQFFFRELRWQGAFRHYLFRKINQEMDDLLAKGQVRKIIKSLKIYDVDLGSRAPSITDIRVPSVELDPQQRHIDALDIVFSVSYSGGLSITIDVALAYGKSAFLSAKVSKLEGEVMVRFSRRPYSHWSVAFSRPPLLDMDIKSRVQGRCFRHVTQLVASHIQKLIQKKHTLPCYRIRHKPFFRKPEPWPSASEFCMEGQLDVTVVECCRLNVSTTADSLYCTLALSDCAWNQPDPTNNEGVPLPSFVAKDNSVTIEEGQEAEEGSFVNLDTTTDCPADDSEVKRTASYPYAQVTLIEETQSLRVRSEHRFLNVAVWLTEAVPAASGTSTMRTLQRAGFFAKNDRAAGDHKTAPVDVLLGHVSVDLAEIASGCQLNTQGHYVSTYKIHPADPNTTTGRQDPLADHVGFDARLCYGDLVLSLVHRTDGDPETTESGSPTRTPVTPTEPQVIKVASVKPSPPLSVDLTVPVKPDEISTPVNATAQATYVAATVADVSTSRPHNFVLTHFTSVRLCDSCHKKIWLREAFRCSICATVCHKKCIKRSPEKNDCCTAVTMVEKDAASTEPAPVPASVADSQAELLTTDANPFLMRNEDDPMDQLDAAVCRLLSCKYDESFVSLAKDSGRHLYSHLEPVQRRAAISSAILRLEAAVDMETILRSELASRSEAPGLSADEKRKLHNEMAVCEEKRQALALLLLHYCAGLQHAEQAEEIHEAPSEMWPSDTTAGSH